MSVALAWCAMIPTASPATADSNARTHHISGPQIRIRLESRNCWNSVTGFWADPPKKAKSRTMRLTVNSERYSSKEKATRAGETITCPPRLRTWRISRRLRSARSG